MKNYSESDKNKEEIENKIREEIFKKFAFKDENTNKTYKSFEKEYIQIAEFGWSKENPFIDFHERMLLVFEISQYYSNETNPENIDYNNFIVNIPDEMVKKAKDRVRKNIPNVAKGTAQREMIILTLFVMEASVDAANKYLRLCNMEELYSRNIFEGLIYYHMKKRNVETEKRRTLEELYQVYSTILILCNKYEKFVSPTMGKEFVDAIFSDENNDCKKDKFIKYKKGERLPRLFVKNKIVKGVKFGEFIKYLNQSIKDYEQKSGNDNETGKPMTTHILKDKWNRIKNINDAEQLIIQYQNVWCSFRNKPLKVLVRLMYEIKDFDKITFNDFALNLFSYYCIPINGEKYTIAIKATDRYDIEIDAEEIEKTIKGNCISSDGSQFPRTLAKILFGCVPLNKNVFITIYLFLCDYRKNIVSAEDIDKTLTDCGYTTLDDSEDINEFILMWFDNYKKNEGQGFRKALIRTYEEYVKENDSPIAWF